MAVRMADASQRLTAPHATLEFGGEHGVVKLALESGELLGIGRARVTEALEQFADNVGGVGGAASVAADQDQTVSRVAAAQRSDGIGERVGERGQRGIPVG